MHFNRTHHGKMAFRTALLCWAAVIQSVCGNNPTPTRYCFDYDPATTYSNGDMCYDIREIHYITVGGVVPAGVYTLSIHDCNKVPETSFFTECRRAVGGTTYTLVQELELWTYFEEQNTEFNFCFDGDGTFLTGTTTCSDSSEITIDSIDYNTACNSPLTGGECEKIAREIATGLFGLNFGSDVCVLTFDNGVPFVYFNEVLQPVVDETTFTFKRLCKASTTTTTAATTLAPVTIQSTTQSTTVAPAPPPETDGLLTPAQHHVTVAVIGVVVGGVVLYSAFRNK